MLWVASVGGKGLSEAKEMGARTFPVKIRLFPVSIWLLPVSIWLFPVGVVVKRKLVGRPGFCSAGADAVGRL